MEKLIEFLNKYAKVDVEVRFNGKLIAGVDEIKSAHVDFDDFMNEFEFTSEDGKSSIWIPLKEETKIEEVSNECYCLVISDGGAISYTVIALLEN